MQRSKTKTGRRPQRVARRLRGNGTGDGLTGLKFEVAKELGLDDDIEQRGFANMTTREVGKIGGQMVRRLVARGKRTLGRRGR